MADMRGQVRDSYVRWGWMYAQIMGLDEIMRYTCKRRNEGI